jgi:hypothetical protein
MKFVDCLCWLVSLEEGREYVLKEANSNLEKKIQVQKSKESLSFEIDHPFVKLLHNENSQFIVSNVDLEVKINNYRIKRGNNLLSRKCEPYIYQSVGFNEENLFYYRLLSPINSIFYLVNLFEDRKDNFQISINNVIVEISVEGSNYKTYLVIESLSKLTFSEFKHISNSVLYALGFFNGHLIKGEEFFFQSKNELFDESIDFFYRKHSRTLKLLKPFTSIPTEYSNFINDDKFDFDSKISFIKEEEIEKFITIIHNNDKVFSTINVLFDVFKNSFISKPSVLFVVLEILSNEINKVNDSDYIKKVNIRKLGFETLKKYEELFKEKDYEILKDVVENVDKKLVKNIVNFEKAFNSLKLSLSDEDKDVLKMRNYFFHGNFINKDVIIKNEEDYVKLEMEYHYLAQRLFTLISKLLLKYIGFSGFIINHAKVREKQYSKYFKEEYFVKI